MTTATGFCVIYRWRLAPGSEEPFRQAWGELTRALKKERGALGSRLHQASDGSWVAYAQWPSEEAWRASSDAGSPDEEASEALSSAIESRDEPILLYPSLDLLDPVPAGRGGV